MADRADDHPGREPVAYVAAAGAELEPGGGDTGQARDAGDVRIVLGIESRLQAPPASLRVDDNDREHAPRVEALGQRVAGCLLGARRRG